MNESLPEVQLRLAELKQSGAHAVAAIKTIRDEFQLSLGEAKLQFSQSSTWASATTGRSRMTGLGQADGSQDAGYPRSMSTVLY